MKEELSADIVFDAHAGIAEGPLWDERRRELVWTDIPAECVHFTDISNGRDREVGGRVARVGGPPLRA
jgi:sugar lactone lactonase YvrE